MGVVCGRLWRSVRACPALAVLAFVSVIPPVSAKSQETICDRGDTEVRRLSFDGNLTFTDAELANGIVTTPSTTLYKLFRILGTKRCLDRNELPLDALRIRAFYRSRGFQKVQVSMDSTSIGGGLSVSFLITEGEPMLIDTLIVSGLEGVRGADAVRSTISVAVGDRFDMVVMQRVLERTVAALQNGGYPRGDALLSVRPDTIRDRASIEIQLLPGPLSRVATVLVSITQDSTRAHTPPAISEASVRHLLGIEDGEYFSRSKLFDAQRRLFQTDVYRNVQISAAPDSLQPASDSLIVLQAILREGTVADLRTGVGWGTLDCFRAQAAYTNRSFLGHARQLEIGGRVSKIGIGYPLDGAPQLCRREAKDDIYSDTLNFRLGLTLRQPGLFGLGVRNAPTLSIYTEQRSEYLAYFRSVPLGFSGTFTLPIAERAAVPLPLTVGYSLEYGRTEAQPAVYCALFDICGEEERRRVGEKQRLAVASVGLSRDTRDFPLDPAAGTYSIAEFRHASTMILSDASLQFNTLVGEHRRYWDLGSGIVLSARVRGGVVLGRQLRLPATDDNPSPGVVSGYVPPVERLYAGGPNSVRGFRFNELGPEVYIVSRYDTVAADGDTVYYRAANGGRPDRSVPAGGNTMLIANVEARLPSPFLSDLLAYSIFVDAGEVWNRGQTTGSAQARFDGIKITPGVGVRIFSPVGPIRIDVGYNPYDRQSGVAYFDAPIGPDGVAPLYCVSPGNTLKVVPGDSPSAPAIQLPGSGGCGPTFVPQERRGLRRLIFNFSIGQAF